ncbi:MAG TPA: intein-containing Rv2578c family radical SAM protein [Pseudonocardiaceae bacterium]|nr:intein-containing Rv2578c family radical SAM protein [Pseudonocardiaceae bacterium]
MRWDEQKPDDQREQGQQALPGVGELVRSVRAPEFAGVVFHEVRARSVLNKVPSSSSMPFGWTVNPYRGCSHGCAYCLAGDTPVLMADGRTTPIADLRVGDKIYGTVRSGHYRRYAPTTVLAHWATVKPAYRITLADGTQLTASGDHRFLSDRGWKHVLGRSGGAGQRPHLTTGNKLMGTGGFGPPPPDTADYRRGYLFAMIRSGGRADPEALDRSRAYLAGFGIAESSTLIEWPIVRGDDWTKGFLAGIFDAEGRCSRSTLRIGAADRDILDGIALALKKHDFEHVIEDRGRLNGRCTVRLTGGLPERLRFFHLTDPAVTGKRSIDGIALKSTARLGVTGIEPLGRELPMFDITTGTGDFIANGVVSHNCFARNSHTYLDLDAGQDFNSQIVVKVNAVEVLASQLRRRTWAREHVAMGTNTDPYQRAEGRYELMPGIVGALARSGTPFSILTKGTVLSRDLPLLAAVSRDVSVGVGVSIALLDRDLQRSVEPGTPSPHARLELVRRVRDAGLPCGVFVAPVLPRLTDSVEALDGLLAAIAEAGATGATVLPLHLRPGTLEWFAAWLRREHPELAGEYRNLFARGSYVDRRYRRMLAERVGPLLRRHGLAPRVRRRIVADGAIGSAIAAADDEPVWPSGSLPAEAPGEAVVSQGQLELL